MANKGLFASAVARLLPRTDAANREGAPAYAWRMRLHDRRSVVDEAIMANA